MDITIHSIKDRLVRRKIKELYTSAFPKYERLPFWILMVLHRLGRANFTAFFDGDVFCGFTYSVTVKGAHFIMFFAVEESLRSKGYGSAILSKIKEIYSLYKTALNVELLDESASNYPDRLRRFEFYKRNGFYDTGYNVREVGGEFRVLATEKQFDTVSYKKVFRKISFGLWNVWLEKVE